MTLKRMDNVKGSYCPGARATNALMLRVARAQRALNLSSDLWKLAALDFI